MDRHLPHLLVGLVSTFGVADLREQIVLPLEDEVLQNIEIFKTQALHIKESYPDSGKVSKLCV